MKVHWTDTAQRHLDAIYHFIAQDSPAYAKRMVDRLTRRPSRLANSLFPEDRFLIMKWSKSERSLKDRIASYITSRPTKSTCSQCYMAHKTLPYEVNTKCLGPLTFEVQQGKFSRSRADR